LLAGHWRFSTKQLLRPDNTEERRFFGTVRVSQLVADDENGQEFRIHPLWVVTPELLTAVGADPDLARSDTALLGEPLPSLHIGLPNEGPHR